MIPSEQQLDFLENLQRNGHRLAAHEAELLQEHRINKVFNKKDEPMINELLPIGRIVNNSTTQNPKRFDVVIEIDKKRSWPLIGIKDTYKMLDLKPVEIKGYEVIITLNVHKAIVEIPKLDITKEMPLSDPFFMALKSKASEICSTIESVVESTKQLIEEYLKVEARNNELAELASTYTPTQTIIEDIDPYSIEVPDNLSIQDKYTTVVGNLNEIVSNINDSNSLDSQKELAEAFIKVRSELSRFSSKEPGKISTLATKYLGKSNWIAKKIDAAKETIAENASVKSNIDYIFGLMHEKYNKLVSVAEGLQKSKATLEAQLNALIDLEAESDEHLATFSDQSDIPMRDLALNTQIKASVEKYRDRISKVKGAVTAMQATIIALGRDLPAHKSDLEDEMALSGLLTNIDDYQRMFGEIKDLVVEVTTSTREKTHEVVDNLMKMQIEDTHTMEAIANNMESSKEFATMLATNTKKLADKTIRDAEFISKVASGVPIENVRKEVKKLKG